MKTEIYEMSALQCAQGIRAGEFSCREVAESFIGRVNKYDPHIKAWEYFNPDLIISQAERIDQKRSNDEVTGLLAGLPVGIKDIMNTKDMPTGMGSPIWKGFTPGNDARVVARMRLWDMVIMGKTVTAEFAVHAPNETVNPHNLEYSPGTSSSGSAAAVAAGMAPIALGTQTGGSIIRPASYCGVIGFKPSFGLLPRTGMLKTTDTLDSVGFFARYVEDLNIFLDQIIVTGKNWPVSYAALSREGARTKGDRPWKIGVMKTHLWEYVRDYVKNSFNSLVRDLSKDNGFELKEVELPDGFEESHEIHSTIYDKTLSYYFKEEYKNKTLVSPVMGEIIERGNRISLESYKKALEKQFGLREKINDFFTNQQCDAIMTNSTSSHAPGLKADDIPDNALIWTLCFLPAITLPAFISPHNLPFGVQIVGKRFHDYLLINLAKDLVSRGYVKESPPVDVNTGNS